MKKQVQIIVGSMLGASEYVADALQETLQQHAFDVQIHLDADLTSIAKNGLWIICSSTHGAGDLPDNIQPFAEQLDNASLTDVEYLMIGLGDSSYDTFCQAAKTLNQKMATAGAQLKAEPLEIDVLNHPIPEDHAVEWLQQWLAKQD